VTIDAATRRWIRNAADERAAANGCTFDEARGEHVLNFARKYLRLYEGDKAGQVLEPMGWQVEVTMRLFGWVRHSERWGRLVRRFRSASVWIPKKNGKSPTLAWWALYLLCADGEMGQKVYLGAVDGQQARDIAGRHVIEMVTQSPDLMAECTINKSTAVC
jgi:phage terminase large subunit-like protein